MTRVRLRVPYISRAARGVPGQVLELEEAAAARLVSAGRATLVDAAPAAVEDQADDQATAEPKRTKRAGGATAIRSGRRQRATPPAEDPFFNPDVAPDVFDPAQGRRPSRG